jgi:hypothetical protein
LIVHWDAFPPRRTPMPVVDRHSSPYPDSASNTGAAWATWESFGQVIHLTKLHGEPFQVTRSLPTGRE